MTTLSTNPQTFESTYALLMREEETQRSRFETLVYTLLIASALFAVLACGQQAITMPVNISHVVTAGTTCSADCA